MIDKQDFLREAAQVAAETQNDVLETIAHIFHRSLLFDAGLPEVEFQAFYRSFRISQLERVLGARTEGTIEDDIHEALVTALGRDLDENEMYRLSNWMSKHGDEFNQLDEALAVAE